MSQILIGVECRDNQKPWVEEFFEFFKTPWEFYRPHGGYSVVISTIGHPEHSRARLVVIYGAATDRDGAIDSEAECSYIESDAGQLPIYGKSWALSETGVPLACFQHPARAAVVEFKGPAKTVICAGYDLFEQVEILLSSGQPQKNASIPALDIHVAMLRKWILDAGIPLVEIPPVPPGYEFIGCLTHDVDFVRITDHKFDHTLMGFIQRASIGSLLSFVKGKVSLRHCLRNLRALASLPGVYLGICEDFWLRDFDRFMELERDMKSTFFFIPFKDRAGEHVTRPHSKRRAAAYDVGNERTLVHKLAKSGNEIAVHGIDAWHSIPMGREERSRIAETAGSSEIGIRMHWLCFDASTPQVLEAAGFSYDSTSGYNDTVGYRAGTHQVFRPHGVTHLLELPLHIQDTALFYPGRFTLNDTRVWKLCEALMENASKYGGALTFLWHTRSMAPERQWDDFYIRLLKTLKNRRVWFGTAAEVVGWFRYRRSLSFQNVEMSDDSVRVELHAAEGANATPNVAVRFHSPGEPFRDIPWTGETVMELQIPELRRC
jgi:peptidoglycan/xylan/chitin deacetylase (PgdA/CDA1 family)